MALPVCAQRASSNIGSNDPLKSVSEIQMRMLPFCRGGAIRLRAAANGSRSKLMDRVLVVNCGYVGDCIDCITQPHKPHFSRVPTIVRRSRTACDLLGYCAGCVSHLRFARSSACAPARPCGRSRGGPRQQRPAPLPATFAPRKTAWQWLLQTAYSSIKDSMYSLVWGDRFPLAMSSSRWGVGWINSPDLVWSSS